MSQLGILELNAPEFCKAWKSGPTTLLRWSMEQLAQSTVGGVVIVTLVTVLSTWKVMPVKIVSIPLGLLGAPLWGGVALLAYWVYKSDDIRVTTIWALIMIPLVLILASL